MHRTSLTALFPNANATQLNASPSKKIAILAHTLTLIAVPDCIKINIVLVIGEEEEAEP